MNKILVVVTYDVSLTESEGAKRLRKVAKICQNYGQRVQNSVFECVVNSTQLMELTLKLEEILDKERDSIRIYRLGNNYENKVSHMGVRKDINIEEPLLF